MDDADINTKINDLFEIPVTDQLKERLGDELLSERRLEARLNREVLPAMEEFIREEFPHFKGRFTVTRTGPVIRGQFQSQSIVKTSMDQKALDVLRERLNEFSGGREVFVQININCFL